MNCVRLSGMGPIGPELRELNRELLASRLGWPDGALEAVRKLEADHEGYLVFWSPGEWSTGRGPGFYGRRHGDMRNPMLYATTAEGLAALLEEDSRRFPPVWW